MRKKEGFTLVELLVVIAIIALLMSILMPALAKVREQAKDVMCKSNLRQWGAVFSMYANDNEGYFMTGWMGLTVTKHTDLWPSALRPYYANGDLRLCPSAKKPASEEGAIGYLPRSASEAWGVFPDGVTSWGAKPGDYGSYGINAWACNPSEKSTVYQGDWEGLDKAHWRGHNVNNSAIIPLFMDARWMEAWAVHWEVPPQYPWEVYLHGNDNSMWRVLILRHNTHINCLFLDYSVDKVEFKKLWKLKWHRLFDLDGGPQTWPNWMGNLPE